MTITICCLVPWSPLNEHGHDYTRAGGPVTPASCSISELEIHDLIRTRTQFRKSHDFCNADRIWGVLRRAGVFVDDATTQWRADGLAIERTKGQPMILTALQKVDELLSGYLDYVGDPVAKGRMTYEVAASCPGPHRPADSTSNAVGWNSPNGYVFLSLIELPLGYNYGSESLRTKLLSVASHLGCFVKIYGDVKHCDPYVLVNGKTWGNVDEAVKIIRGIIERNEPQEIVCSSQHSRRVRLHVEGFPPSYLIGLFIRHGEETLTDMQRRYGCQIDIRGHATQRGLACDEEPAYAVVSGFDPLAIDAAAKMIESVIDHRKLRCVPIPVERFPKIAGYIVGKLGRTLKDMENKTGCTIQLRGKGTRFFDNEPANAFIDGDNDEAVGAASMMVESLIVKYSSSLCFEKHVEERQDLANKPEEAGTTHGMKIEVNNPRDEDSAYWL